MRLRIVLDDVYNEDDFNALADKRKNNPFIAQKLVIVTTKKGKEQIQQDLVNNGRFSRMCIQNDWPEPHLEIKKVCKGKIVLDDVYNEDDFNALADTVMNAIRELIIVNDDGKPVYQIHASLAGGRKTMSYYLGQAMNIFGRPNDKLSHVLLKPEYELKVSNFFYPYQPEALLTKDKPPMPSTLSPDADDIVSLTEFPVIRLSSQVNMARFNNPKLHFSEILQAIDDEQNGIVAPMKFTLGKYNKDGREVSFGFDKIKLSPENLAVLLWLGWRAHHGYKDVYLTIDNKERTINQYYLEYIKVAYYVQNGLDKVALDEYELEENTETLAEKQIKKLAPKLSKVHTALQSVSGLYAIKDPTKDSNSGYYRLTADALSIEDFLAVDNFMKQLPKIMMS
jgi:CRISPR-associated protein (TIGR02584 family)